MDTIILDKAEHYEKMTGRNRYNISGSNNSIMLSVPLMNGRNQHVPMREVRIHNGEKWQVQHWRTLVSVYKRSPFFDHYEPSMQPLFEVPYTYLAEFNKAALLWVKQQLRLKFELMETDVFVKQYPQEIVDMRPKNREILPTPPVYYQVFEDRVGFLPDLSILDLLFSEGPQAANYLSY